MTMALRKPAIFSVGRPMSRDKADTLLLLSACALVLLPHLGHLPGWVGPACTALLAWRGWVTFRGNRMPPRWLLLPIAALAMVGVLATFKTLFGRDAGIAMLSLLLTLKLLEMHAKRDLFVALFLSFFLILASFFYSQSIGTALMTIAAVIVILTTQLSFQYTGSVPPLKRRLLFGAAILALAAPVTLVLFLLFPRIEGPLWGMPGDAQAGRSGMSDTMSPGNIARLALSDEIAFRVEFSDPAPPKPQRYWRGVVLGDYDGRTWSQARQHGEPRQASTATVRGVPIRYQVTLEPHRQSWLYALDIPANAPLMDNNTTGLSREWQINTSLPINDRVRYDAASHVDFDLQPDESPMRLRQWLALPRGFNPRTLEFAARLRAQMRGDVEAVNTALRFFREQAFRYTLEPPVLGRHAVDEFLFDTRAGFCEHYASAFVVLMRAAGIPARVVVGYQGGEINPADNFMAIRQSDAHAWTEVWLQHRGWMRIDPTAAVAPERIEQNLTTVIPRTLLGGLITLGGTGSAWFEQLKTLRRGWEAVNNAWNQWVLNYTPERQKRLVESLGFERVDAGTLAAVMTTLAILAVAIAVLPLMLHEQKKDPLAKLYDTLCRRMARKGLPKQAHEGPRAYRMRLTTPDAPLQPELKAALAHFLELYETVRYGAASDTSGAISKLKSLLAECR
jgi:protein-glutamine gamma-glutamyltransferase